MRFLIKKIGNHIKKKYYMMYSQYSRFNISVMNIDETLNYLMQNSKNVVRFGDGEFNLIKGEDIPFQKYNSQLAQELRNLIIKGTNKNILVCMPDVFNDLNKYTDSCKDFWLENFFYQNRRFLKQIEKQDNIYGSAFISRPYMDLKNKTNSKYYFSKLKSLWDNRDLLIVEGKYTRSGEGNDLFANAKSIKRIICPSSNSFDKKEEIENSIKKFGKDRLVLLMLGPTAKVIVSDLSDMSEQLIDIGHIDSEYEWFRRKATEKINIVYKHTAEFNFDDGNVHLRKDKDFEKEVCKVIE